MEIVHAPHAMPTAPGRPRLLVIEDDASLCEMLTLRLSQEIEVLTAMDGERGIMIAQASRPDAFLVDLFLPRLSGLAVVRFLKHQPRFHHAPVIIMSAYLRNLEKPDAVGALADAVLAKPFDLETLGRLIRPLLHREAPESAVPAPETQRRAPRVATDAPAVLFQGGEATPGSVRSLSPMGALFTSDGPARNAPGEIAFELDDVPLRFPVEILYAHPAAGRHQTGLRFRAVTLDDEFRLWRYVESRHALAQRDQLSEALVRAFEARSLQVLAANVGGRPEPRRIRRFAPDVLAFHEREELLHFGVSLPGFALSEPRSRDVLRELAGQEMADGASRGRAMPLWVAVPAGWGAVARRIVTNLGLAPKARDATDVLEVPL